MTAAAPSPQLLLRIYKHERLVHSHWFSGCLVLGRQDSKINEPPPYEVCGVNRAEVKTLSDCQKLVIASSREVSLSRTQALLEILGDSRIRLSNISEHVGLYVDGRELPPLVRTEYQPSQRELDLRVAPLVVAVDNGECSFRVERSGEQGGSLMSLNLATLAPGQLKEDEVAPLADLLQKGTEPTATELAQWLLSTMSVFHEGTNTTEFLTHAADSLGALIGLDYVAGLAYQDGQWQLTHENETDFPASPSTKILNQMLDEKRSFRSVPEGSHSLAGVTSVVAAPILNLKGDVVGALYGDRRGEAVTSVVSELEQMVVELVAAGVANGIARLEQQRAAMRAQVQFEQFFGPLLAEELNTNQELLEGRETEVTVLFCDIRGFSRISHRVGPSQTLDWINDVLNELSKCVVERDGVLVDYIGDELMAMWGAPRPSEAHAHHACLAALDMKRKIAAINERWNPIVGETTDVGIGINTGLALVGNTGSQLKFKYGPMGTTVNLASRICGATKALKRRLLITSHTMADCGIKEQTRRLCTVEVVNIPSPVEVFEVEEEVNEDWRRLKEGYESALRHFEESNFRKAVEGLGTVLISHPKDDPSVMLLARAVSAMTNGPEAKHPVWVLEQK